jgi:penicillin amidase
MRFILLFLSAAVTSGLCFILDTQVLLPAPLGKLLSPQEGIWQNADPIDKNYSADLKFSDLKGKVDVYFDKRLVPHIFAEQENDAYFVQGYLHAKFRLWQMELQVLSAAGRASEVVGEIAINHDREFRRLGMVYAAENSLQVIEGDEETKFALDAYTSGINAYVKSLTKSSLPLEYKLLGYRPELWTNLKTALFLKYMSFDLSGYENDFEMTNAKHYFSKSQFDLLFPSYQDSVDPVIPTNMPMAVAKAVSTAPLFADSIYFDFMKSTVAMSQEFNKPNPSNGSNNWVLSGKRTKSGAPILCNDPHLGLNLPSLWYEMQISVPQFNAYGVSFPGAPSIIIGFNDSCAFGFTNGGRDVRDYYEIKFKDESKQEYWFDSSWKKTTLRIETIKIKGKPDLIDTVAYTLFGPVMYDASFQGKYKGMNANYAVKWSAHDSTNEMKLFYLLNRSKNYLDYVRAARYLKTPGQNIVFACKNGDIAIRTQGKFPAKWKGQGDFIMPGFDSSYLWQGYIPADETPYQFNPDTGYVSSANQRPVDTTYPYYLGRNYPLARGLYLNRALSQTYNATASDMMKLQLSNYDIFASMAVPLLLQNVNDSFLNSNERKYLSELKKWNYNNEAQSIAATFFQIAWRALKDTVYNDEYAMAPPFTQKPYRSTLLEAMLKDTAYLFVDDIHTSKKETLQEITMAAFKKAVLKCDELAMENKLQWGYYKDTRISHLLKLPSFSVSELFIGGGEDVLNASQSDHGPSWKMIVSLTPETEAYGIYPGGQEGNPGSYYYDNAINSWAEGKYYKLWVMKPSEKNDSKVKWTMHFDSKN